MKKDIFIIILVIISILFFSCSNQKVFVSERHAYSYDIVKSQAIEKKCSELILLDYHNDIKSDTYNLTSYNWISKLIEENIIDKVYWISGGELNTLNRNARMKWLERNLTGFDLDTQDKIRNVITLLDFKELKEMTFTKNVIITLDFDVLTKNPGPDEMDFTLQMCNWIQKQKCPLLTLSFSSVYFDNPENAFLWFNSFIKNYNKKSKWYLLSSDYSDLYESAEEKLAWENWKQHPEIFNKINSGFYKNAYFWLEIPLETQSELLKKNIQPFDEDFVTKEIINIWKDKNYYNFKDKITTEYSDKILEIIKNALNNKKNVIFPDLSDTFDKNENLGVAIRLKNTENDRGCLAVYYGLNENTFEDAVIFCTNSACEDPRYYPVSKDEYKDLIINVSVFSKWEKMNNPYDFVPGIDCLIVENKNAFNQEGFRTLLQPAIAIERSYSKKQFLECLCKKAGLPEDSFLDDELIFYKSKTVNFYDTVCLKN